jgi:superfamily II DNA helicase RecQ
MEQSDSLLNTVHSGLEVVISQLTSDKFKCPKEEQTEAVHSIFNGQDTVCVLNTGYGKSMIFFALSPLHRLITGKIFHHL